LYKEKVAERTVKKNVEKRNEEGKKEGNGGTWFVGSVVRGFQKSLMEGFLGDF